jgi:soluble lytic murein transglycosylase-like protein
MSGDGRGKLRRGDPVRVSPPRNLARTAPGFGPLRSWVLHGALLVPALLGMAVAADARLVERRGPPLMTNVEPNAKPAPPESGRPSLAAPARLPATDESRNPKRESPPSVANAVPDPASGQPGLLAAPPVGPRSATADARFIEPDDTLSARSVTPDAAPALPWRRPTAVPGLGPKKVTGEARFITEGDGTLFVTNVAPTVPEPAAAATRPAAPAASGPPVGIAAAPYYRPIIQEVAARHAVPAKLVESVIHAESNFNPRAVSHKGARGLMQLMPATAQRLGVRDVFDARQNIEGGVRHLRHLLDRYGDFRLALAAYNAGDKAVDLHRDVPPINETRAYVDRVLRLYGGSASRPVVPTRTVVTAPGGRSLFRYQAPDGTIVYTNLSERWLPASTRDLLAGKGGPDGGDEQASAAEQASADESAPAEG